MSKHPTNVTEILGTFTLDRVKQIPDVGLRSLLEHTHAMVSGLGAALLAGDADAVKVKGVSITLDDVTGMVDDANHLLDEIADRDAKHAAALAAVAALHATEHEIQQHLGSFATLLRGTYGPKSPDLKKFGVLPLATGGRRAAAKKAAPAKTV